MSDEDLTNYKTYISDLDITKYIVLDNESNYWYSAEYVDKMLKKQDKEIERLTISLQAQEELTMNWYNKVKKARDLFYEKCRISQNGAYIFNEVDYEELSNILGSDKE